MQHTLKEISTKLLIDAVEPIHRLQTLWSGYGELWRVRLLHAKQSQFAILKIITPPKQTASFAHKRKIRSYQVEAYWYAHYVHAAPSCRMPKHLAQGRGWLLLEDLDQAGFPQRALRAKSAHVTSAIQWLAQFHAHFIGVSPKGLWTQGCYWHLATRPDELKRLQSAPLKQAATQLDQALHHCQYTTLLHGDAKLENFCFNASITEAAAVDFQYVGAGCGMKDLVYLLDSALSGAQLAEQAEHYQKQYFDYLSQALLDQQKSVDVQALKQEWQSLYVIAWADLYRFLGGWQNSISICDYVARCIDKALSPIASKKDIQHI